MGRATKKLGRREIEISPERAALLRRIAIHGLIACFFFGGLGVGFYYIKQYVDREVAMPTEPPTIIIKNKPHWMSDFLVRRIAATARPTRLHSAYDHDLLVQTKAALEANPWISKVYEVRRAFREKPGDTLEIDCEYRVPTALVKWGAYYWLVDRDGFKLPDQYEPGDVSKIVAVEDGHVDIRVIEGVHRPPPATGKKWLGEDLAAGLEMAALLSDKPYAQDIQRINVAHFGSAREPHVVLVTRYNPPTEIRWGRTPSELEKDPFLEVTTAKKLDRLQKIYTQFGRVDAGQKDGLDIRFDGLPTHGAEASSGMNALAGGQ
ncbi:MAG TPA: hypothetical protein VFE47_27500 [Tepidisphaeraceae bacterium]|jgi:cell division septal protein FtsQ|nr:hypothetical protein [Tepidisphaeraceae bacterium]